MNGVTPASPDDFVEAIVRQLDAVEHVSTDRLHQLMTRDGSCMALYRAQQQPEWSGDELTDREVAARVCAGCPVQRECLELELRTSGAAALGVWGALPAEDVRALYPVWQTRRHHRALPGHRAEGGERA